MILFIIFLAIGTPLVIRYFFRKAITGKDMVCRDCGTSARIHKRVKKGGPSIAIALVLFALGFIPGLIYFFVSDWTEYHWCPKCFGSNVIPVDSPIGRQLAPQSVAQNQTVSNEWVQDFENKSPPMWQVGLGILCMIVLFSVFLAFKSNTPSTTSVVEPKPNASRVSHDHH